MVILAYLNPYEESHPTRGKVYRQFFDELNIEGFDVTKSFKCSVMHKFEKLNKLIINIFEINFYQDKFICE